MLSESVKIKKNKKIPFGGLRVRACIAYPERVSRGVFHQHRLIAEKKNSTQYSLSLRISEFTELRR